MSEPTYSITITETERTALAKALGRLVEKLVSAPVFVEEPSGGTQAARSVLSPPSSPAAAPSPSPVEPRDRWARDKKGNELPNPEGSVAREITVWKTEYRKPRNKPTAAQFLRVTWQSHDSGYVDANCFDAQLFPWIVANAGKKMTFYLVKSGEYLNIVGVRA